MIKNNKYLIKTSYSLSKSIVKLREGLKGNFDETVDIVINLNLDVRKSEQQLRGLVNLPNGTGKTNHVAVFTKADRFKEAKEAGANIVGGEDLIDNVKLGKIDFNRCIATPDIMPLLSSVGKILGPKGLMPNPKLGTVTNNIKDAIRLAKSGQIEYRTDKNAIIHAGLGKMSFSDKFLEENIRFFFDFIAKLKPKSTKGVYIKNVFITSTQGPSVRVDMSDLF